MAKRRPDHPSIVPTVTPDPALISRRATKAHVTHKQQWKDAIRDMVVAKDRLVDALLVLQGVQVDYQYWLESSPPLFKKSASGRRLIEITQLNLTLDLRHLTAAAKLPPP